MNERKGHKNDRSLDRIRQLINRQLQGELSDAEYHELTIWLTENPRHRTLYEELADGRLLSQALTAFARPDTEKALAQLRKRMESASVPRRLVRWLPYAAAAILVLAIGIFFLENNRQHPTGNRLTTVDIQPGGNRATLTLGNGRAIDLSEEQTGIVVGDGITYTDGTDLEPGDDTLTELVLTTPKAGTYQVVLPDGSRVWLNAASTMKYPNKFTAAERVVEITGEAYFAIVKDPKRPFKVVSEGQEIEVLGTEFNVSAYADEDESKTTLVNGSIAIVNHQSKVVNKLNPGQQATTAGIQTRIKQVDTRLYTAWKDGYFNFKSTPLEEVLRQVSRWYDIEVKYPNGIPADVLGGKIKRDVTLLGLIEILQISNINVTLEGRALIVN